MSDITSGWIGTAKNTIAVAESAGRQIRDAAEQMRTAVEALEAARKVPEPVPGMRFRADGNTYRVIHTPRHWTEVPRPHMLNEDTNCVTNWYQGIGDWKRAVREGLITILDTPEG